VIKIFAISNTNLIISREDYLFNNVVSTQLPLPPHYKPEKVGQVWKVDYEQRAIDAPVWAEQNKIAPASEDRFKIALILIDIQNTFCLPEFELFVGGRSGRGAIDDNQRLCEFIYRNLHLITKITATMDTHTAMQIFHPIFLVNDRGEHPAPHTLISYDDVLQGRWRFNPKVAPSLGIEPDYGQNFLLHYTKELRDRGKYDLTIWPYHSIQSGIGHAMVSAVEEAVFFHTIARNSQAEFEIKGSNPLTEHYSALGPEVLDDSEGSKIGKKSEKFIQVLQEYDAVIIAGQAKSHCVAWTIDDLLGEILQQDEIMVRKIFLLEDCSSPVVVPGVVDYTEEADAAFAKFSQAGMHVVRSTDPITEWLVLT
jgi:nicotinamidase-related amidase